MIVILTDDEYQVVTTLLEESGDFTTAVRELAKQYADALQEELHARDFRICHKCGKWSHTWRFGPKKKYNRHDKISGEWLCYDDLTPEQQVIVSAE